MLSCGHEGSAGAAQLCAHLRECREPWLSYVKWYSEATVGTDLLCLPCAKSRESCATVIAETVCAKCYEIATEEVGFLQGVGGKPEIRIRPEPFNRELKETALATEIGKVLDLAPLHRRERSNWLLLAEDGGLIRFEADTGEWMRVATATLPLEPAQEQQWNTPRRRLHASMGGEFAAVVNDYGRYGQIIDLRTAKVTLSLDAGDYYPSTVPLSFVFTEIDGRVLAIHRTAWNRLDISDPSTGELLTQRGATSYEGDKRPPRHLDYFHGALHLSPSESIILDDGWVWQPSGVPVVWSVRRWIEENVWESEDGPTRQSAGGRDGWNGAMTWLGESRFVAEWVEGDNRFDGAQIFRCTSSGLKAGELIFGPKGTFFSDGTWLFSSDESGLSRWDVKDGARTGHLPAFRPSHYHRFARELVELREGVLVRLRVENA